MRARSYWVYIVASRNRTLYTGVTNNIYRRVVEHKQRKLKGFSQRYNCDLLVHWEHFTDIGWAILREKQIKGWLRAKKVKLIETGNPEWRDLSRDFLPPQYLTQKS